MTQIDVKTLDIFAGIIGGTDSLIIEIFLNIETGDKFFSVAIFDREPITVVYKYPKVNPIIYQLINYIESCGKTKIENGSVYGPHLVRKSTEVKEYYLYETSLDDETFILEEDIVSKNTKLRYHKYFKEMIDF